jgi:hypothetical protein
MAKINYCNQKKKILMLEYYFIFQNNGIQSVADDLNVRYSVLQRLVHDYKKNDCLIIKSTL